MPKSSFTTGMIDKLAKHLERLILPLPRREL